MEDTGLCSRVLKEEMERQREASVKADAQTARRENRARDAISSKAENVS